MADFAELAAVAKRLIDENGRTVSIIKLDKTAADPNKPWRGPVDPRATPIFTVTGKAVFVPLGGSDLGIEWPQDNNLKRGDQVCLFAADNDTGQELEKADEIEDGAGRWAIINTQLLQPADQRLLYFFEVAA